MPVTWSLVSQPEQLAVQLTHIRLCMLELTYLRGPSDRWSVPARLGLGWTHERHALFDHRIGMRDIGVPHRSDGATAGVNGAARRWASGQRSGQAV